MKAFESSDWVVWGLALTCGAYAQSSTPSFDCSKDSSDLEKLICTDEALAALDRKMAEVFEKALGSLPSEELSTLKATQRGWIKGRDECSKADDLRECVEYSYRSRIVELQIQSGQLEVPSAVGYTCQGNEGTPVFATYYTETDPPSAVITVGNEQVIAFRSPSGSGAKYAADDVELWEHQGTATLEWLGRSYECKTDR
ncbi:MAG TPA: MliC family protein [Vicinamibacteria bacterium]|nr:MliC family protein [Vicinamibacteria bacterium]